MVFAIGRNRANNVALACYSFELAAFPLRILHTPLLRIIMVFLDFIAWGYPAIRV